MTSKQKVKISSVLRNITAIVVSAVLLTLVWPHLPRSTELAQGCTVTTAGTIATIYGNLYAAVARLWVSAALFFTLTSILVGLGYLYTSTSALATKFRERRAEAARRRREEAEYAASVKDVKPTIKYTEIDKYVRDPGPVVLTTKYDKYMPNNEPSMSMKLFCGFYRTLTGSVADARFTVTLVTCAASLIFHIMYIRHHVCAETNSQILGVWVSGITLTAVAAFVLQWMYLSTWPMKETTAALDKVFGSLDVAKNGRLSDIMKLPVVRIPDVDKGSMRRIFESNLDTTSAFVHCERSGNKWHVTYEANEISEHAEGPNGNIHTRLVRRFVYRIEYDGFVLKAGPLATKRKSGKDIEFAAGVVVRIPLYTTISAFINVFHNVSADVARDDKPAHEFIAKIKAANERVNESVRIKTKQQQATTAALEPCTAHKRKRSKK